jgi:Glycosyl hydrolases family 2, TIM barrel domain/Glycosyl hydrolases family 2, sugar binding domain/Glycosyl hydrolases family 2
LIWSVNPILGLGGIDLARAGPDRRRMTERQSVSLDGIWDFRHARDAAWRAIAVPAPWQSEHADLRHESGKARYRRQFTLPAAWDCDVVAIRFGAVSYFCEVILNGQRLGEHEGGYLPFEFVVPRGDFTAENVIEVQVVLPDGDAAATPDFPFAEIPHGKQSWYGPIGGLWQSVVLEGRATVHAVHVAIDAKLSGEVRVAVAATDAARVRITLLDPAGTKVAEGPADKTIRIANVQPWSPDNPALYTAVVEVENNGRFVDVTRHRFGFRSFEARGGKFFLNGEPFYMRGALDQDYYPAGISTPPSLEFLEDQFRKAKALGLNLLRCHIKVPDPRYYEVADRLGLLVWTEIPNVATFTEASARRMRETMAGIVARDGNHPCIVAWTLINEDWGTRLIEDASHRQWLKDTYDWLKQLDPTRLVVDNSACHSNFHVKSDINDYHYYRSVPERRAEWDKLTEEFARAAKWTYSSHGDAEWRGDEPLVVSEFGVWGLPDPKLAADTAGQEPWWMETGANWGDGAAYPHGVQNRFAALRLGNVFGSFDAFIEQAQWYQFRNLKYEIESLRAHDSIQGYVITEFTDVHWESNGLLDMNRNPRVFHQRFADVNAETVIVPKVARYSAWCGDRFSFGVGLSTGTHGISGVVLKWHVEDGPSGALGVDHVAPCTTGHIGIVTFTVPESTATMCVIALTLERDGAALARNQVDIAVFPKRDVRKLPTITAPDAGIAEFAQGLGYRIVEDGDVTVRHSLDAADIQRMQARARYLVLADGTDVTHNNLRRDKAPREQPFMPIVDDVPGNLPNPDALLPNIVLHQRQGTLWRGDWIANFSWIRRSGAFAGLPGGPLLDLSYDRVVPHHVMTGFRAWEFGGAVHGGLVLGWVHKPAATIADRRVGQGKVLATTFRLLRDAPGDDPVAAVLFDAMVEAAARS